jgi:tetratricopeptide (TPR) repeat protein
MIAGRTALPVGVTKSRRGMKHLHLWLGAVIALATAVAYFSSLHGVFVFDDLPGIVENPTLRHPGEFARLLFPPAEQAGTVGGRPLLNLTLAFNYAMGGLQPGGYHAFNLVIHIAAALLLFGVIRRTLEPAQRHAALLAAAVALLWALHPLNTQAVTYVIQRAESLMGLWYLLTLYSFIRGWKAASVLACLAGMATKEPMVSAPLAVFLYDRTFIAGSYRAAWLRHRAYYAALASTWIVLAGLVSSSHGRGGSAGFTSISAVGPYVLTQSWAIVRYLRLALWPHPLIFDYGLRQWTSLPSVLPEILLILLLLAATIWTLVRRPAVGFLGFVFFAILAPSSSFVPIATEPIAEHRMYLPLAAVIVLAICALHAGMARATRGTAYPRAALLVVAAIAAALGLVTAHRNRDYRSAIALWSDTSAKLPANARAHNDLGTALRASGQNAAAAAEFADALSAQPDYAPADFNLGVLLLDLHRPKDAIPHLQRALAAPRHQAELQLYLTQAFLATGRLPDAIIYGEAAARGAPANPEAAAAWGTALAQSGRYREAAAAFQLAVAAAPASAGLRNNCANALALSGQLPAAIAQYREALRLQPADRSIQANLDAAMEAMSQRRPRKP